MTAVLLFGWNSGRSRPVLGSTVAASKSATPSKMPLVRMKALTAWRRASSSGVPFVLPRLDVMVAWMILTFARAKPVRQTGA